MLALRVALEALKFALLGGILAAAISASGPAPGPAQTSLEDAPVGHLLACWPGDDPSVPGTWDYCPDGYLKDV